MISARGRAVVGAVALAAATASWVGPGALPAAAYVCSSGIESPGNGSVVGAPAVRFTGPFDGRPNQADRVLVVTFTSSPGPRPATVTRKGVGVGSDGRFDVLVSNLDRNGEYKAQLRFSHAGTSIKCNGATDPGAGATEQTAEVTFGVSVKARPPANVRSRFAAGPRTAVVSWGRSPDPDTARYSVTRKVGSTSFEPVADVAGDATSWTDTKLPGAAATITYAVSAARRGPDSRTTSEPSAAVAAAPLGVPAPPPSSTTPTSAASTGSTVPFVLGQPAATDLGAAPAPSPDGLTPLPQGGDGQATPPVPGLPEDRVQLPGDAGGRGDHGDGLPQLAYVGATLLSAAVAAHVLWRRGPLGRPGAAALDPALPIEPTIVPVPVPVPASPVAAAPAPDPSPPPVAAPRAAPLVAPAPVRAASAAAPAPRKPKGPPPPVPAAPAPRPSKGPPPPVPAVAAKPILIIKAKGPGS